MILLLFSALAIADVVDDPPEDCPAGSRGQTSHWGAWCEPDACADDPGQCAEGTTCQALNQCIVTHTYTVDTGDDPRELTYLEVVSLCAEDGSCAEGTCTAMTVCADEAEVPGGKTCGCASTSAGAIFGLGALALLSLGARRR